jgi:hypothetical protein
MRAGTVVNVTRADRRRLEAIAAARKPRPQLQQPRGASAETLIVDVVEQPLPGVTVVTEFETTRVSDTDDE